jgi:nitrogen fixation protein
MGLFSRKEKVAEKVEEESLCAFLFKDNRREQALNKIYEKYNAGANKFLINGSYYDIPLNTQLPKDTEAWKLYDMHRVYYGVYNDAGFYECCEIDSAEGYLDIEKFPRHMTEHIDNIELNAAKTDVWMLYCLNNENVNKITFMKLLAGIKYPKVLDDFFGNYKIKPANEKGALELNYSQLPWTLMEAKKFSAYSNDPNTNSIYQFIKHFPTESTHPSIWLMDEFEHEMALYEIEQRISFGVSPDTIKEIWEYAKIQLPKAYGFHPDYSWNMEQIFKR